MAGLNDKQSRKKRGSLIEEVLQIRRAIHEVLKTLETGNLQPVIPQPLKKKQSPPDIPRGLSTHEGI